MCTGWKISSRLWDCSQERMRFLPAAIHSGSFCRDQIMKWIFRRFAASSMSSARSRWRRPAATTCLWSGRRARGRPWSPRGFRRYCLRWHLMKSSKSQGSTALPGSWKIKGLSEKGRFAPRIILFPMRDWSAGGSSRNLVRSAWLIMEFCFWTSCRSSKGECWRISDSLLKKARWRSLAPRCP